MLQLRLLVTALLCAVLVRMYYRRSTANLTSPRCRHIDQTEYQFYDATTGVITNAVSSYFPVVKSTQQPSPKKLTDLLEDPRALYRIINQPISIPPTPATYIEDHGGGMSFAPIAPDRGEVVVVEKCTPQSNSQGIRIRTNLGSSNAMQYLLCDDDLKINTRYNLCLSAGMRFSDSFDNAKGCFFDDGPVQQQEGIVLWSPQASGDVQWIFENVTTIRDACPNAQKCELKPNHLKSDGCCAQLSELC